MQKRTNNIIYNIKNGKPFKRADIFIYIFCILISIVLLFYFIFPTSNTAGDGFCVFINNEQVLKYNFSTCTIDIKDEFIEQVIFNKQDCTIKVYSDNEKTHYNIIKFDNEKCTAFVLDSNCSSSKDCTYFTPITKKGGEIYCLPHGVKISALKTAVNDVPITG